MAPKGFRTKKNPIYGPEVPVSFVAKFSKNFGNFHKKYISVSRRGGKLIDKKFVPLPFVQDRRR